VKRKSTFFTIPGLCFIVFCCISGLISCTSGKQLAYFKDLPDSTIVNLPLIPQEERVVEMGDRIQVMITGKDPEAANFFNKNTATTSSSTSGSGGQESGYLVDFDGMIEFPIIGKVSTKGLTAKQIKENLTKLVSPYLKEPLVDVTFTTFKVTVLGEVRGPGSYTLNSQRTTILDALAAAGDLPHSAKRYDVSILRDYNGKRTIRTIDLGKKEILYNPDIFQMKHNDVVYVKPRNQSVFTEDFSLFASMFSILLGVFTLVFTLVNN
jgi:polysaccharide export outer membrane protein